jgi:hypothetical protein
MVGRPKGTPKTGGRKRGTPNEISGALKEAILEAAEQAGGEDGTVGYLRRRGLSKSNCFIVRDANGQALAYI